MSSIAGFRRKIFSLKKKLSRENCNHYVLMSTDGTRTYHDDSMVPKGFLPVYIGEERKRYVVPLEYLLSPKFQVFLLEQSDQDEFDIKFQGPIMLHCTTEAFERVLRLVKQ
ncbi:Auxin-induced protein [Macleaya cordata]|uniref:Auxin-induced protein n=1 Tax=Macleaya cordata TaxID=56857 RepID=A0A200QT90_MACCD|nr:Auxin-induced protein [Macleaya cordata]